MSKKLSKKNILQKKKISKKKKYILSGSNVNLESLLIDLNKSKKKKKNSEPSPMENKEEIEITKKSKVSKSLDNFIKNEVQRRISNYKSSEKTNESDISNTSSEIKPNDVSSDNEDNFCSNSFSPNNNNFLKESKDEYVKCIALQEVPNSKCEKILEQQIEDYLEKQNKFEKENEKLINWPGIPDTEPEVPFNKKFYSIINSYFSGKTGPCNFTIPLMDNIKNDSCSVSGGSRKKFNNNLYNKKTSIKKQFGGKIHPYRHQVLVSKYLNPNTPYRGILAYHGLGSGKTLLSALTISNFIKSDPERVICYIAPPGLVGNFYKDFYKLDNDLLFNKEIASQLDAMNISLTQQYQNLGMSTYKIKSLVNEKLDRIKEREIKRRIIVMSYESWGNRLRGRTAWDTPVNLPDVVNSKNNKQGIGGIISSSNHRTSKMDTIQDPLFNNTLVIMDEVQELIASKDKKIIPHMNWIQQAVRNAKDIKILFMTATPIKSHPYELGILLNLLKPLNSSTRFPEVLIKDPKVNGLTIVDQDNTKNEFNKLFVLKKDDIEEVQNINIFRKNIIGLISYYSIERNISKFAKKIEKDPIIVDMSLKQYNDWRTIRNKEMETCLSKKEKISCNNNSIKKCKSSRQVSLNVNSRKEKIKQSIKDNKLSEDAHKILYACDNIDKLAEIGKQFVYSEFNVNGVLAVKLELRKRGWIEYGFGKGDGLPNWMSIESLFTPNSYRNKLKAGFDDYWVEKADYSEEEKSQKGWSGGGIWSNNDQPFEKRKAFITLGENTDSKYKEGISKGLFNRMKNINGDFINTMIVNSKYAEGISLMAVRQVHILEPPTSLSLRDQIIGRAIRSCSHKGLQFPDKWNVSVYEYYSTYSSLGYYKPSRYLTIDNEKNIDFNELSKVEKDTLKEREKEIQESQSEDQQETPNESQATSQDESQATSQDESQATSQDQTPTESQNGYQEKNETDTNTESKMGGKISKKIIKQWCNEFEDSESCNVHEYCQWNTTVDPDNNSSSINKCLELPTDFVIEKMADRADHLKQQFLRLLKESAIDCSVFKNANEAGLKCFDYENENNDSSVTSIQDNYNLNLKACQNLDMDKCNENKKCIWNSNNNCDILKNESDECQNYKNSINCIKNSWCLWNENNEKCYTYYVPQLKNMENGIYFFYYKDKENKVFKINDNTYLIIENYLNKQFDELSQAKTSEEIINKFKIISKLFISYNDIKENYKNKLVSIANNLKKNEVEIWSKNVENKYKSILENIINQNNFNSNIGKIFLDEQKNIDEQLNAYSKNKTIKDFQEYRNIYLTSNFNDEAETINLKKYKEAGNQLLNFVIKLQVGRNIKENKNGLDYLLVSNNIPDLGIDLEKIEKVSEIIKKFNYHSIKIKIVFFINAYKLEKIEIIYNVDKELSISPINNKDIKLTTEYKYVE